jgi:hypothetical protein
MLQTFLLHQAHAPQDKLVTMVSPRLSGVESAQNIRSDRVTVGVHFLSFCIVAHTKSLIVSAAQLHCVARCRFHELKQRDRT